jgi:hypothetical protein
LGRWQVGGIERRLIVTDEEIIAEMKSIAGRHGEEIYDHMWQEIIDLVRGAEDEPEGPAVFYYKWYEVLKND